VAGSEEWRILHKDEDLKTAHTSPLGRSNQVGHQVLKMQIEWTKQEVRTEFWQETFSNDSHFENRDTDERKVFFFNESL
jgi:hypothetical protein